MITADEFIFSEQPTLFLSLIAVKSPESRFSSGEDLQRKAGPLAATKH